MMCSRFEHTGKSRRAWHFIFAIPFIAGFLALAGLVVMLLWNSVIIDIFSIKAIGYFQAIGLLIISKLLFGGFHRCRPPFMYDRSRMSKWKKWHDEEMESQEKDSKKSSNEL